MAVPPSGRPDTVAYRVGTSPVNPLSIDIVRAAHTTHARLQWHTYDHWAETPGRIPLYPGISRYIPVYLGSFFLFAGTKAAARETRGGVEVPLTRPGAERAGVGVGVCAGDVVVGCPRKSSALGGREPARRLGLVLSGAQAWVQHSAGTCPNSWRDGFARDCPLRHPVAPMLALRDRAGASVGFSVDFRRFPQARSAEPRKEGGAGARRGAVSQRSSREPIFVVRVVRGKRRDTVSRLGRRDRAP